MHVFHFRFRTLPSLFLALCSILVFAFGCGGAAPSPTPPPLPQPETSEQNSTLTLWHTLNEQHRDALAELTREFHNAYPDLSVNPVYVGTRDDLTKQFAAAVALGTTPDLVLADRRQIAEFAAQGGLQSLDKFLDDTELGYSKQERADFWRGAFQLGRFPTLGSRTFGIPFRQEPFVLFYNASALKDLNVNRAPQTWEQFGEYASLAPAPQYGWAMRADAATFEAMLASRGSALLTDSETRALFNERAGLNSLKLVADLSEGNAAVLAASDEKARREFGAGNAAYYLGWMSEYDALRQAQRDAKKNFEIGVGILPQLEPTTPWLLTRGDFFGMTKIKPERARKAWFFVRWITAPTQSARWVRATNALPLTRSTLNFLAPDSSRNIFIEQVFRPFKTVPPRLVPQPASSHIDTVEQVVSDLWLQAVQPKPDLRAILDAMVRRINQILAVES